ncbi:MAG: hypothetical protein HZB54_01755 [Deltaproteobacteria bacterium]|nr:hypothetical protein [Deltaproteobacteria bacterium]
MTQSRILTAIFLFSFSALSYEIILTRIFSISLWYHFAFMVISIAMLGIGASGTVLSLYPKIKDPSKIGSYGLFLGAGISLSYILSNQIPFDPVRLQWDRMQLFYICLYYIVLSIPFFFFGLSIATAFSFISEKSGLLYGSDLLGAGTGSIAALFLMSIISPEKAIFFVSAIALTGAFIVGCGKAKIISLFLIMTAVSFLIIPGFSETRMSPYKGLQVALKYPGAEHIKTYNSPFSRIDIFKSPAVRFAPGLSLKYLDALPEQIGISIDGGDTNAVTHADNKESLKFLRYLPAALVYEVGKKDDVLILEPKGGLEVLLAEYYGSKNIYKVDSNPLAIKVIRDDFRNFSHDIYSQNTFHGMGRSWLKSRGGQFDIIDIPFMGASPFGSFGITEDYRFTVEAFKEYLGYLKNSGTLSINLFILPPPRMELRLLNTIVQSMEEIGIKDVKENIVALRSWGTICILAKRSPFFPGEIEAIRKFSKERRFDLIYYPGVKEEETNIYVKTPSNGYYKTFENILNRETRQTFESDYVLDISPVSDEAPFFHYYLRLKNIKAIYEIMGKKWHYFIEEGYLLPVVFIQALVLSIIIILIPAFSKKRVSDASMAAVLPYFAFLGLAFMFVEISLIQKMILPLETPSYAVAAVLTSLLISSGIGSLLIHRFSILRKAHILIAIALLIIIYSLFLPTVSTLILPYSMQFKIASVCTMLMPLGMLMGIPFPLGLKILGEGNPSLIPWAWAINGCFSVLAPILTIMLAMAAGFKIVLWIGAVAYLLAFFTFPNFPSRLLRP